MNKRQAKRLFRKYVNNECSDAEKELLDNYIESFQDKSVPLKELNFESDIKNKIWQKIALETIESKKENKLFFVKYLKYAAVLIAIFSLSIWFFRTDKKENQSPPLVISEQPIILKTGDNKKVVINTNDKQALLNNGQIIGKQNGASISYTANKEVTELVYNEIEIPNGRTFRLILSDGTAVHLNAGSTMKYPVNFIPGKQREIYLQGEAYFEVSKDLNHAFVVNANNIGVKVLGTHFNVNSYENTEAYAVLAEGSVVVYNQLEKNNPKYHKKIAPGQKASLLQQNIEVKNVNISHYLGWLDGRLLFNNENFMNIVKKIERKYNVVIENKYLKLNKLRFRGDFKNESIIDLLDTFKESAGFNYKIVDNKIIINKP